MLDRTTELVADMVSADQADPVAAPARTALLTWCGLHGIVTLRIDKNTIPWPDPHHLAHEMLIALVRPRPGALV